MKKEEYNQYLKQYHKHSERHILVVETDMPSCDIQKVVVLSHKLRKAGNELIARMKKKYEQLLRTKRYRKLLQLYGETEDKTKRKELANQMKEMQKSYQVTWEFCRTAMIPIGKKYGIDVPQKRFGELKVFSLRHPQKGKSFIRAKEIVDEWTTIFRNIS